MIAATALRKTSCGLPAPCTTTLAETIAISAAPIPWRPPTMPREPARQAMNASVSAAAPRYRPTAVVEEVELEIAGEDERRERNCEDDLDGSDHDPCDDRAQRNRSLPRNGFLRHPHAGGP